MPVARHCVITLLAALGCAALAAPFARAQQAGAGPPPAGYADPPDQAGRLSYAEGSVGLQPAGTDGWIAPLINQPLTAGDQLWSDRGSLAEIELPSGAVRIAGDSGISLLDLNERAVQLGVGAGTVEVTVRQLDPNAAFEIDAPNAAVSLLLAGTYRISVNDGGHTTVALREGAAQVTNSANQSITLQAGQAALFGANGGFDALPLGPPDDFERWCAQRDARAARNEAAAAPYVADDAVGYQDLGDNGDWEQDPQMGSVWYPQVAAGWAPYRYGQWAWVGPWGWSWIDNAPWGFTPFHYGRWTHRGSRWGWVPGSPGLRAVYAPALVAWIGGPSAGMGPAGGPLVGWLPLAPGEIYLPGSAVSPGYVQNVNVANTIVPNNAYVAQIMQNPALQSHYANSDAPHALSVMSQSNFLAGRPVARHLITPPVAVQALTPSPRAPAIRSLRANLLGAPGSARASRPPPAVIARSLLATRVPPRRFERPLEVVRNDGAPTLPPSGQPPQRTPGVDRSMLVLVQPAPRNPSRAPAPTWIARPEGPPTDLRFVPERAPQAQTQDRQADDPPAQPQQRQRYAPGSEQRPGSERAQLPPWQRPQLQPRTSPAAPQSARQQPSDAQPRAAPHATFRGDRSAPKARPPRAPPPSAPSAPRAAPPAPARAHSGAAPRPAGGLLDLRVEPAVVAFDQARRFAWSP